MMSVRFVPTTEQYIDGVCQCIDVVARERKFLARTQGPPIETARAFARAMMAGAGVQILVIDADENVVGWCDIIINATEGFRHSGQLGMGLLPAARGQGLGRKLAQAAIERAFDLGLERIELEVFASNESATALYRELGFTVEGVKERARKIDGTYDDIIAMALLRDI